MSIYLQKNILRFIGGLFDDLLAAATRASGTIEIESAVLLIVLL